MRKSIAFVATSAMTVVVLLIGQAQASLISMEFQSNVTEPVPPHAFSGVESQAAAADSAFAAASTWNQLNVATVVAPTLTDGCSFSNLVDSTGATTSVGFSITGKYTTWNSGYGVDALRADYLFVSPDYTYQTDASINWDVSGLAAGQATKLYFYSNDVVVSGVTYRDPCMITVDTNGNGSLADETAVMVTAEGVLVTALSGAGGHVLGSMTGVNFATDAVWAGMQISQVPEPSTLVVVSIGLFGLVAYAWRRRQ